MTERFKYIAADHKRKGLSVDFFVEYEKIYKSQQINAIAFFL